MNWRKYIADLPYISAIIALLVFIGIALYRPSIVPEQSENKIEIPKVNLCDTMPHSTPSAADIKANVEVKDDEFVQYLRKSIDAYLHKTYTSCTENCPANKLTGSHYPDSAYNSNLGPAFNNTEDIQGKFIVLEGSGAIGGGVILYIMFKNNPDKVFVTWIYNYENIYDLRSFKEKTLEENQSIVEIQKSVIDLLCSPEIGA